MISSPELITSLTIFILLFERLKLRYNSFNPTTSLDSGIACTSIIPESLRVDVIFTVFNPLARVKIGFVVVVPLISKT